jgi:A/G-specific adenine glycosylase
LKISDQQKQYFASKLIDWYLIHKRDLPWRNTDNPYHILLSEIILQQTRVEQGMPYYLRFISLFPTVHDLANADESTVLRVWQGLGYYSRARNLHATMNQLVALYNGEIPANYQQLLSLKGVGIYTASAIASFGFGLQHAVVDGNVYRVLSRMWGIQEDIATGKGKAYFQQVADSLLPIEQSSIYNQAIMEFGAIHCTPKNPSCSDCIFNGICEANRLSIQHLLPVKTKKLIKKQRFFNYIVFKSGDEYGMVTRTSKDIWQGLNEFWSLPEQIGNVDEGFVKDFLKTNFKTAQLISASIIYKHILTHQTLFVKFFIVEIKKKEELIGLPSLVLKTLEEISELPKPILISNFLEQNILI